MKQYIFVYLFVIACGICIFQFVIGRNAFSILSNDNQVYRSENQNLKDSIQLLMYRLYESEKKYKVLQYNPGVHFIKSFNIDNPESWLKKELSTQNKHTVDTIKIINENWFLTQTKEQSTEKILLFKYHIQSDTSVQLNLIDSTFIDYRN